MPRQLPTLELKTTVGVPLHKSSPWFNRIVDNITRLSAVARVIVSDDTELDDCLPRLREEFHNVPHVEFLGKRNVPNGWVGHCNDLKALAKTEFFMWLPHDDAVGADWIVQGQQALEASPEAILAIGSLRFIDEVGVEQELLVPSLENEIPHALERVKKALLRQFVTQEPGFGHSFHSVQRAQLSPDLPTETPQNLGQPAGWKADVFWSLEALSLGTFVVIEAEHLKQRHRESESSQWDLENNVAGFRESLLKHLQHFSTEDQLELASTIWDAEATNLRKIHLNQKKRIQKLLAEQD